VSWGGGLGGGVIVEGVVGVGGGGGCGWGGGGGGGGVWGWGGGGGGGYIYIEIAYWSHITHLDNRPCSGSICARSLIRFCAAPYLCMAIYVDVYIIYIGSLICSMCCSQTNTFVNWASG